MKKLSKRKIIIMIIKCCELEQKEYMTRHDWVGKVIYWELCKILISDHTNKWYMHNVESFLEKDAQNSQEFF